MKKLLGLLPFVLLLAGCDYELPSVESAYTASTWVAPDSPAKTNLSAAQVNALSTWFADHQTGWKSEVTDTPPGTLIFLKFKNSKGTWVNLQGDKLWIGNCFLLLSSTARSAIQTILGPGDFSLFPIPPITSGQ